MSSGSGSGLGSSQITASVPSPRIEILCVPFKNEISFLQPFGLLSNHHLPSKPGCSEGSSSQCRTFQARELTPLGEPLQCNYSQLVVTTIQQGMGLGFYCKSAPPTIYSLWFLFDVFSNRRSFLVDSYLFHRLLFSRWLWFWCAHEK